MIEPKDLEGKLGALWAIGKPALSWGPVANDLMDEILAAFKALRDKLDRDCDELANEAIRVQGRLALADVLAEAGVVLHETQDNVVTGLGSRRQEAWNTFWEALTAYRMEREHCPHASQTRYVGCGGMAYWICDGCERVMGKKHRYIDGQESEWP